MPGAGCQLWWVTTHCVSWAGLPAPGLLLRSKQGDRSCCFDKKVGVTLSAHLSNLKTGHVQAEKLQPTTARLLDPSEGCLDTRASPGKSPPHVCLLGGRMNAGTQRRDAERSNCLSILIPETSREGRGYLPFTPTSLGRSRFCLLKLRHTDTCNPKWL